MLLTPIQPKIHHSVLQKFTFCAPCVNQYAKEKNTTIFTNHHGELLATLSDYLFNNMLGDYTCTYASRTIGGYQRLLQSIMVKDYQRLKTLSNTI